LKKPSQNQKNISSTNNNIDNISLKVLLHEIRKIEKSNEEKSYRNKDKFIHHLKDERLLK
jgi:hypothetical protein